MLTFTVFGSFLKVVVSQKYLFYLVVVSFDRNCWPELTSAGLKFIALNLQIVETNRKCYIKSFKNLVQYMLHLNFELSCPRVLMR